MNTPECRKYKRYFSKTGSYLPPQKKDYSTLLSYLPLGHLSHAPFDLRKICHIAAAAPFISVNSISQRKIK